MGDGTENGQRRDNWFVNSVPERFIPLIQAVMREKHVCAAELARRVGISKTIISRSLSGQRPLRAIELQGIFLALEIDQMKALVAIGKFNDWQLYFENTVTLVAYLIDEIPDFLIRARSAQISTNISLAGARELARRLSDMVAKHDAEVHRRQEELQNLNLAG